MHVHGDNLLQKEKHTTKYLDANSRQYLIEIREKYNEWKEANEKLVGPVSTASGTDNEIIDKRVELFNTYKDFLDQQHYAENFDSRSNLHSSVLEEFVYYLFRDLIAEFSQNALIGKSHAFKDIFFQPTSFKQMLDKPNAKVEKKDHDFVIGVDIKATMVCEGSNTYQTESLQMPAIAIECKTYLDKTMLEGSSNAADQILLRNPNAMYLVVAEWLKLTDKVNLKKYNVDQIYVLRKQKNTDREFRFAEGYVKNPVYSDVVFHLFKYVRDHLISDWSGGTEQGLDRGYLK